MADDVLADDNESTRGVTTPELLQRAARAIIAEAVRSMVPGRVVRAEVNANGQQVVDVLPLVNDFHRDETGALVVTPMPVITNVAVSYLSAGGFTFTVPIVAGKADGTTGALFFSQLSLDRWLASTTGAQVDPELYTRFNLADAVFVPGLQPFGMPGGPNPPTDHATAGSVAGKRIHFRDNTICIGDEAGSKLLVLHGDAATAKSALATWAQQVEAGIAGGGGTPPSPTFAAAAGLAGGLATVASSATQAKGH